MLVISFGRLMPFQSTLPTRGSDTDADGNPVAGELFQSTLPTRGSDAVVCRGAEEAIDFNPRSPRGGATKRGIWYLGTASHFNPRSPRGGATICRRRRLPARPPISIHAPHEGERLVAQGAPQNPTLFQSTLPTRGSDCRICRA